MRYLLLVLFWLLMPPQAMAYFKCTDGEGGTTFQEFPCPETADQTEAAIRGEHRSNQQTSEDSSPEEISQPAAPVFTEEYPDDGQGSLVEAPLILSRISSAIAAIAPVRVMISQYYAANGEWPAQLADVGLGDQPLESDQIESVVLESGGVLIARLKPGVGDGKSIALQPYFAMGGTSIEWKCFSNFPASVLNYGGAGTCESRVIQ